MSDPDMSKISGQAMAAVEDLPQSITTQIYFQASLDLEDDTHSVLTDVKEGKVTVSADVHMDDI
uniref:Uncharacterized protein n=1 Tax=Moniliophthora roreri TaxID=221103 RepID=A0A0W0G373_MONRR